MSKICWDLKSDFQLQSSKAQLVPFWNRLRARRGHIEFSLFLQSIPFDRIFRDFAVLWESQFLISYEFVLGTTRYEAGDADSPHFMLLLVCDRSLIVFPTLRKTLCGLSNKAEPPKPPVFDSSLWYSMR